jgi:hypothetical protein
VDDERDPDEPVPDEDDETMSHESWLAGLVSDHCEQAGLIPGVDHFSWEWHVETGQPEAPNEPAAEGPAPEVGDFGGDGGDFGGLDFGF